MMISNFKILQNLLRPIKIYNPSCFKGISGFSLDSRSLKKEEAFIALLGKYKDGHKFINEAVEKGAALVISQKDVPAKNNVTFLLVKDTAQALKDIASYIIKIKQPFSYAITGSVGKTTTKDMLAYLLADKFKALKNEKTENNILGLAKTVFSLRDEKVLVAELGTNAPGEIKTLAEIIHPQVGVITFIKPAHLEGLKNLKGIYEEKVSLLKMNPKIKAVLNRDDPYLNKIEFVKDVKWFGKKRPSAPIKNYLYAKTIKMNLNESIFYIQDKFELRLPILFCGFIYNCLAAIAAAQCLGIPLKELVANLSDFKHFPQGRAQIQELDGMTIFNDAHNANPYSFKEALKTIRQLPQKKIAVIGDMLELGKRSVYYHELLAKDVLESNFDYVLTIGSYTRYLQKKLKESGYKKTFHFSSCPQISRFIRKKAKKGYLIFLKGSRNMELEKVITAL